MGRERRNELVESERDDFDGAVLPSAPGPAKRPSREKGEDEEGERSVDESEGGVRLSRLGTGMAPLAVAWIPEVGVRPS